MARLFGRSGRLDRALWSIGVGSCLLAFSVLGVALLQDPGAPKRHGLFMAGTALLAGGVGAGVLGWRPRRLWVMLDDLTLSRPWARGSAILDLRQLSGIQGSKSGGVVVSTTSGAQLRIDGELPDFPELLELICDRITDNGYPTTATVWRDGQRRAALNSHEVSFRGSDREPATRVGWREIQRLEIGRDERQHLVPLLVLADGRRLTLPYLGRVETLELYRAVRQMLRRPPSLPLTAAASRASRAPRTVV